MHNRLHAHNRVIVANVGAPFNAASNRSTFFQIKLCRSEEYALLSPPSDVLPYRGQPVPAVCDSALNRVCSYVNNPTLMSALRVSVCVLMLAPCPALPRSAPLQSICRL